MLDDISMMQISQIFPSKTIFENTIVFLAGSSSSRVTLVVKLLRFLTVNLDLCYHFTVLFDVLLSIMANDFNFVQVYMTF